MGQFLHYITYIKLRFKILNRLFDSTCVPMRITINKLDLIPKRVVSGAVGVLWNGEGLGTGESDVSGMLLYPVFHMSSSFVDVNFALFTGNSVNNAILFSRVGRISLGVILT